MKHAMSWSDLKRISVITLSTHTQGGSVAYASLHSPVGGRQDVGLRVRSEHQLSSDGFHHQALGDAQQEVLIRVSRKISRRSPPPVCLWHHFHTVCSILGVHREALFPLLSRSLRWWGVGRSRLRGRCWWTGLLRCVHDGLARGLVQQLHENWVIDSTPVKRGA